ncbi:MAG: rRNA maturation RNase YbeY [Elusimicrobia bacterium]|nr:rRNA maturation RNase YbeY [Elusimicrobiota bacterium]
MKIIIAGMAALPASARRAALYQKAVRLAFATSKKTAGLEGEANVVFLERAAMLRMNRHYLGHDYDTDVIAFKHEAVPGLKGPETPIGDVFISAWMARRQAGALGHSVAVEAATLAVHGALHLLGHDDQRPAAKARMFKVQDRIVASLRA